MGQSSRSSAVPAEPDAAPRSHVLGSILVGVALAAAVIAAAILPVLLG